MKNTNLKPGSVYQVTHSRKGKFTLKVESVNDKWASGIILSGQANAALNYNVASPGQRITVNINLCAFEKVML